MYQKHKVFISYHHQNDQDYKQDLIVMNDNHDIFIDASVDTGDIDDHLSDEKIREKIRDEYLRDSTVTVLLLGTETKNRKHIDWELYSSMYDGKVNKKSGILIISLPSIYDRSTITAGHGSEEKQKIYPNTSDWTTFTREDHEKKNPYMPDRIIDNLIEENVKISVTHWEKIQDNPEILRFLINITFRDKESCEYDLTRPMKRSNDIYNY